ncbi:MAG: hypothetical protein A3I07_00210 [Candidatus Doudnabacteria bacterium RIFCSPLOWO2_02_FULL_42_9]|uniref:Glycerophosphoryl diester phosphodiesterase membrane domain-containing protein n=1 Tax=Candidatus Doudnabacteria bacterium RIFCSPHIGHO2_01_FULL_41_86 TaxID=1817821 RepID=A0A1F5N977_9BACT|nr:MAG: hypothetical protein A2717_01075 [Candidatus Doudnabacteria bacterium RIFCSPHIGHO2_01_FULL_41_86]OGE75219.1 MAG: hypothetical protein A3K07_00105 [Candidatus Doudnabacteria bacterium RIFCSPHIGHO2_01_43_10]OGE85166.1 MAG: hypothetical protein A3E28_00640 [Candidatus Doudnabacteria bacterium RIFCSPHIGHO2_12_FULL_42_22]OGE86704.1 MAG: hypothetical protein A3C49_01475 [Candidatus Doudnabacteria bacterium RIFCSPHIGHO2_02_FULL_42_25]OGE92302.1 MAG: hypothetical protein A2895_01630 [Candidatus
MQYNLKMPGAISLWKESWALYKERFSPLLKISALIFGLSILTELVFPVEMKGDVQVFSWPYWVATMAVAIVAILCSIAMVYVIKDNAPVKDSLQKSTKIFWPYFFSSIIAGLIMGIGFVLLIVPGIIFSAWYGFIGLVVVIENIRYLKALKRSKDYVKGHTLEVVLRWIFIMFILFLLLIPTFILNKNNTMASNIYADIVLLFYVPIIQIYTYLMYLHLKEIKNTQENMQPSGV